MMNAKNLPNLNKSAQSNIVLAPALLKIKTNYDKWIKLSAEICNSPKGNFRGGTFIRSEREKNNVQKVESNRLKENRQFNAGEMKVEMLSNSVNTVKSSAGRKEDFSINSNNKVSELNAADFAKKLGAKFNKASTLLAKGKETIDQKSGVSPSVREFVGKGSFRSNPNLAKSSLGALASLGVPKFAVRKPNKKKT